jgi:nucleotidyltransferase-like protein/YCII-related domain-containing protein
MHIYAFGSICRGEILLGSDIDLLALVDGYETRLDPDIFSLYSYGRVAELWSEGNPFAWHLFLESKLIFTADGSDFLNSLGAVVLEVADDAEAKAIVTADPAVKSGIFVYEMHPWELKPWDEYAKKAKNSTQSRTPADATALPHD